MHRKKKKTVFTEICTNIYSEQEKIVFTEVCADIYSKQEISTESMARTFTGASFELQPPEGTL